MICIIISKFQEWIIDLINYYIKENGSLTKNANNRLFLVSFFTFSSLSCWFDAHIFRYASVSESWGNWKCKCDWYNSQSAFFRKVDQARMSCLPRSRNPPSNNFTDARWRRVIEKCGWSTATYTSTHCDLINFVPWGLYGFLLVCRSLIGNRITAGALHLLFFFFYLKESCSLQNHHRVIFHCCFILNIV